MDASITRQLMQSRLHEFIMYYKMYQEHVEKQQKSIEENLPKEERAEFGKFIADWEPLDDSAIEMIDEIDIRTERLNVFWEIANIRLKEKRKIIQEQLTFSHNNITIIRTPLQYSSYALSAGYDKMNQKMDIEYKTGKLYRYNAVPEKVFEKIITLKSLRDMKVEIEQYEFERLV